VKLTTQLYKTISFRFYFRLVGNETETKRLKKTLKCSGNILDCCRLISIFICTSKVYKC